MSTENAALVTMIAWAGEPDSPAKRAVIEAVRTFAPHLADDEARLRAHSREAHAATTTNLAARWVREALSWPTQTPVAVITVDSRGFTCFESGGGVRSASTPYEAGRMVADVVAGRR